MVMQHPVTTETKNKANAVETLEAIMSVKIPTIWFWPNIDAGTDDISNAIRIYREKTDINEYTHFVKFLPPEKFIELLKKSVCLIGNSSAGIKECSYLGVPVVNIGSRQQGRMRAGNVTDVSHNRDEIVKAIKKQIEHGPYGQDSIYFQEDSSKKIADMLKSSNLYIQKKFYE